MNRVLTNWMAVVVVATTAGGAVAQDPPAPDKSRLYVEAVEVKTLSVPAPKEFSRELEWCVKVGGSLVGATNRGVVVIDVPQDKKEQAKKDLTDTKQAKPPVDALPANAGEFTPITQIILGYTPGMKKPSAEALKEAGMKEVPGKESVAGSFIVVEVLKYPITDENIKKLKAIVEVTTAQASQSIERPESRPTVVAPAPKPFELAAKNVKDEYYADGRLYGMRHTSADKAWAAGFGKVPIIVAVIDSGVDIDHPDLKPNIWTNPKKGKDKDDVNGYDFVAMSGKIFPGEHGTHVAGTIAAALDGLGVVGVCPGAKIMPLRFLGPKTGADYDAILCIDYAIANGAKVINASFGGLASAPPYFLGEAIKRAKEKGVLVVAAAGNSGHDNDGERKFWPASFDIDNVISVMAVDQNGGTDFNPPWSTNYGLTKVHLAAPGHLIWSTIPDKEKPYAQMSGTSMAAPHVSGAAALLWGHKDYVNADYKQIRTALLEESKKGTPGLKGKCAKGLLSLEFLVPAPQPKK